MKHVKYFLIGVSSFAILVSLIVSGLILTPMLPIILQRAVNGLCIGILAFVVLGSLYCMGEELYNDIFGKKKKSGICTYYDGKKWRDTEYYE